jgi:hypothetical protein
MIDAQGRLRPAFFSSAGPLPNRFGLSTKLSIYQRIFKDLA